MAIMQRKLFSILILAGVWAILFAGSWVRPTLNQQAVPKEWRLPTENELKKNWQWTDQEIKNNLQVTGDFDGDGFIDQAKLMIKNNFSAMGLLVIFSPKKVGEYWMLLEIGKLNTFKNYRIASKKPSVYEVSCKIKKPCLLCQKKEPCKKGKRKISIKTPTIVVNNENVFIWNKKGGSFLELLNSKRKTL